MCFLVWFVYLGGFGGGVIALWFSASDIMVSKGLSNQSVGFCSGGVEENVSGAASTRS